MFTQYNRSIWWFTGVGDIDVKELKGIATNDDFVYKVPDFSALSGVTNDVIEMTCYASKLKL